MPAGTTSASDLTGVAFCCERRVVASHGESARGFSSVRTSRAGGVDAAVAPGCPGQTSHSRPAIPILAIRVVFARLVIGRSGQSTFRALSLLSARPLVDRRCATGTGARPDRGRHRQERDHLSRGGCPPPGKLRPASANARAASASPVSPVGAARARGGGARSRRVRQFPLSGKPGTLLCRAPLRTGLAAFIASGSSKP